MEKSIKFQAISVPYCDLEEFDSIVVDGVIATITAWVGGACYARKMNCLGDAKLPARAYEVLLPVSH